MALGVFRETDPGFYSGQYNISPEEMLLVTDDIRPKNRFWAMSLSHGEQKRYVEERPALERLWTTLSCHISRLFSECGYKRPKGYTYKQLSLDMTCAIIDARREQEACVRVNILKQAKLLCANRARVEFTHDVVEVEENVSLERQFWVLSLNLKEKAHYVNLPPFRGLVETIFGVLSKSHRGRTSRRDEKDVEMDLPLNIVCLVASEWEERKERVQLNIEKEAARFRRCVSKVHFTCVSSGRVAGDISPDIRFWALGLDQEEKGIYVAEHSDFRGLQEVLFSRILQIDVCPENLVQQMALDMTCAIIAEHTAQSKPVCLDIEKEVQMLFLYRRAPSVVVQRGHV